MKPKLSQFEELSCILLKEGKMTLVEFEEFWFRYDELLILIKDNQEEFGKSKIFIRSEE